MKLFQSFSFFLNTKSQQKRKRTNKNTEKDVYFGRKNKFHNLLSFFPKDLFPKLL